MTLGGACAVALLAVGCKSELGPCDTEAARELVYSRDGMVATQGQALMHDSCGGAAFCHARGAEKAARLGAPAGMDFDMPDFNAPDFYVPDPILTFVAQGYHHSIERLVELLLEELKIRWIEG